MALCDPLLRRLKGRINGTFRGTPRRAILPALAVAVAFMGYAGGAGGQVTGDHGPDLTYGPTSLLGSYLAGRQARREKDHAAAAYYFEQALDSDPDNPQLLQFALSALIAERRMDRARAVAEKVLEQEPDSELAILALLANDMRAGDLDAVDDLLERLPENGFNSLLGPVLGAWVRAGKSDLDGALARLEPLGERSAYATMQGYHSGLIAELLGDNVKAEDGYVSALSAARGTAFRVIQIAGAFFERIGKGDVAKAIYDDYLEQNSQTLLLDQAYERIANGIQPPAMVTDAGDGFAEALYGLASALVQENAADAALAYVQLALHIRPDLDVALLTLGEVEMANDYPVAAAIAFEAIPADSPIQWMSRLHLADALQASGEVDRAAEILRAMADEQSERSDALISLGELFRINERYEEAVAAYDEAITRIPQLDQQHWTLLYARGMSLERSEQWARAESDLLEALELEPDQPLVLNYLGYSWIEQGANLERARAMIERAVAQRPSDAYIIDSLGWALYQFGEYDEAIAQLERAVEIRPTDAVIVDHLGDAMWQGGRHREARFQWSRALSFDPDPELAATIEQKLDTGLPVPADSGGEDEL